MWKSLQSIFAKVIISVLVLIVSYTILILAKLGVVPIIFISNVSWWFILTPIIVILFVVFIILSLLYNSSKVR